MYERYINKKGEKVILNLPFGIYIDIDALLETVKKARVSHIDLGYNETGYKGSKKLAKFLKVNKTLTYLDLYNNKTGYKGAKKLAAALEVNNTLTHLNLHNNKIGNEGAKKLAAALEVNNTLIHLNLRYNEIGNEGAKKLAAALEVNKTLTYLNLHNNKIGDKGAEKLAAALENNHSLIDLNLSKNHICYQLLLDKINPILERNEKDLTIIAMVFLENKELILGKAKNKLDEILDFHENCSDLRVTIKKLVSVSTFLIKQLLMGKINYINIDEPISNEDPKKLVKEDYSDLRVAIKKSVSVSEFLIEQLLMGEINYINTDEPISNKDAKKLVKNVNNFLNYNLLHISGACKNFTIGKQDEEQNEKTNPKNDDTSNTQKDLTEDNNTPELHDTDGTVFTPQDKYSSELIGDSYYPGCTIM